MDQVAWYYHLNSQQHGPITRAQLSQMIVLGQLPIETMVWSAELTNWTPAYAVSAFAALRAARTSLAASGQPAATNTFHAAVGGSNASAGSGPGANATAVRPQSPGGASSLPEQTAEPAVEPAAVQAEKARLSDSGRVAHQLKSLIRQAEYPVERSDDVEGMTSKGSKWGDLDAIGKSEAGDPTEKNSVPSESTPSSDTDQSTEDGTCSNNSNSVNPTASQWGDLDSIGTPDPSKNRLLGAAPAPRKGTGQFHRPQPTNPGRETDPDAQSSKWGDLDSIGKSAATDGAPRVSTGQTGQFARLAAPSTDSQSISGAARGAETRVSTGQTGQFARMNAPASSSENISPAAGQTSNPKQPSKWGDLDSIGKPDATGGAETRVSTGQTGQFARMDASASSPENISSASGQTSSPNQPSKWADLDSIGKPDATGGAATRVSTGQTGQFAKMDAPASNPGSNSAGSGQTRSAKQPSKWGDLDSIGKSDTTSGAAPRISTGQTGQFERMDAPASNPDDISPAPSGQTSSQTRGNKWGDLDSIGKPDATGGAAPRVSTGQTGQFAKMDAPASNPESVSPAPSGQTSSQTRANKWGDLDSIGKPDATGNNGAALDVSAAPANSVAKKDVGASTPGNMTDAPTHSTSSLDQPSKWDALESIGNTEVPGAVASGGFMTQGAGQNAHASAAAAPLQRSTPLRPSIPTGSGSTSATQMSNSEAVDSVLQPVEVKYNFSSSPFAPSQHQVVEFGKPSQSQLESENGGSPSVPKSKWGNPSAREATSMVGAVPVTDATMAISETSGSQQPSGNTSSTAKSVGLSSPSQPGKWSDFADEPDFGSGSDSPADPLGSRAWLSPSPSRTESASGSQSMVPPVSAPANPSQAPGKWSDLVDSIDQPDAFGSGFGSTTGNGSRSQSNVLPASAQAPTAQAPGTWSDLVDSIDQPDAFGSGFGSTTGNGSRSQSNVLPVSAQAPAAQAPGTWSDLVDSMDQPDAFGSGFGLTTGNGSRSQSNVLPVSAQAPAAQAPGTWSDLVDSIDQPDAFGSGFGSTAENASKSQSPVSLASTPSAPAQPAGKWSDLVDSIGQPDAFGSSFGSTAESDSRSQSRVSSTATQADSAQAARKWSGLIDQSDSCGNNFGKTTDNESASNSGGSSGVAVASHSSSLEETTWADLDAIGKQRKPSPAVSRPVEPGKLADGAGPKWGDLDSIRSPGASDDKSATTPRSTAEAAWSNPDLFFSCYLKNPYRILGLTGSTGQADLKRTLANIRRQAKIGKAYTTPVDLLWSGAIARTERDLLEAETKLLNPESRLQARLMWFHSPGAIPADLNARSAAELAEQWAQQNEPTSLHDAAVLMQFAAIADSPDCKREEYWKRAISMWNAVLEDEKYWDFLCEVDEKLGFEPVCLASDVFARKDEFIAIVTEPLVTLSKDALNSGNFDIFTRTANLLNQGNASTGGSSNGLVEEFFRLMDGAGTEVDELLSKKIVRNENNSESDIKQNAATCQQCEQLYNKQIAPIIVNAQSVLDRNDPVLLQLKGSAAHWLDAIASAYSWADDFDTSTRLLNQAQLLAAGTSVEPKVREHIEGVEQAKKNRDMAQLYAKDKPIKSAPSLFTVNTIGCRVYPAFGEKPDPVMGAQRAIYYFVVCFLPIFPLGSYRVIFEKSGGYRFISKLPLDKWARIHQISFVLMFVGLVMAAGKNQAEMEKVATANAVNRIENAVRGIKEVVVVPNDKYDLKSFIEDDERVLLLLEQQLPKLKEEVIAKETELKNSLARYKNAEKAKLDKKTLAVMKTNHNKLIDQFTKMAASGKARFDFYQKLVKERNDAAQKYNSLYATR